MPDREVLLALFDVVAFVLICHVIGSTILAVVRLTAPSIIPPYALLGSAALALQLWVYGFAHVPWNAGTLFVPWLLAWLLTWKRLRASLRSQIASLLSTMRRIPALDPLSAGLVAISIMLIVIYILNFIIHPIIGWDAVAFWAFKARLFFFDQHVDPASPALRAVPQIQAVRNQEYPPLYPLMLVSTYVFSGRVNESLGNAINLVALLSVVPTMFSLLRRLVGMRLAVALVFLVVALPSSFPFFVDGIYEGYADYVEAGWFVLALIYLQAGTFDGTAADVLAVACAAGAALTKDEGTPLLLFVLAVLAIRRLRAWRRGEALPPTAHLVMAAACVLPVIIWHFTWTLPGTITPLMLNRNPAALLPLLPSRAATIVRITSHFAGRFNTDYWLALAVPLSLALLAVNRLRVGGGVALVVLLQLVAYTAAYLSTPIDIVQHLEASVDRIILQLAPALVLLVGVSISPFVGPLGEPMAARGAAPPNSGQSL